MTRVTASDWALRQQLHMIEPIYVREWSAPEFHRRVLELEAQGYVARRETYRITPEMNPETGAISHLHVMELLPPEPEEPR